ncbi:hypothetical protein L596_012429 [Steinernema carpocapsae]|uniref:Uncharacterized protein n=1 Tax=Steinernema carpocapsae TaxID=34508 RepID=A0A4U5NXN2_STECR|nr:hypothetical protein L596_012429 [Steinernema carpocapsae]
MSCVKAIASRPLQRLQGGPKKGVGPDSSGTESFQADSSRTTGRLSSPLAHPLHSRLFHAAEQSAALVSSLLRAAASGAPCLRRLRSRPPPPTRPEAPPRKRDLVCFSAALELVLLCVVRLALSALRVIRVRKKRCAASAPLFRPTEFFGYAPSYAEKLLAVSKAAAKSGKTAKDLPTVTNFEPEEEAMQHITGTRSVADSGSLSVVRGTKVQNHR